jgi:acyl-CoA synthetase (NDP forming)
MAPKGIDRLITIHNPIDFTPMSNDSVMAQTLEAILSDDGVDAVVMGVVPMTPALKTLPPGVDPEGKDNFDDPGALPTILPPIIEKTGKPVVLVVDSGSLYDPLARAFNMRGLPCTRSADTAVRCLQKYIAYRQFSAATPKTQ